MQANADGEYRYIGHIVDHFTKFRIIFPLKTKTAAEVAENIEKRYFAYFGIPRIIHTDNGTEFTNSLLKCLVRLWPGKCKFVTGRPGHSQSQGSVEQGNQTIEKMISVKQKENNDKNWVKWLPHIQCMYI